MRTLHINTERGWRGGEQQTFQLITGLTAAGHIADAVCRAGEPLAERLKEAGICALEITPRGEFDLISAARIAIFSSKRRHDIIHAHTSHGHALGLLTKLMMPPLAGRMSPLCVSRRVDFDIHKMPLKIGSLKYRLGVARYIAISSTVRNVLIKGGIPPEKINIVPSSVDLARFENVSDDGLRRELGINKDAPVIVSVGSLVGHKAHWHLVRAMTHITRDIPGAICIIVGEGPTRKQIEALTKELSLEGQIKLIGFREDALRFVKMCDVFVISSDMEGLCSSIIEAMAMRKPVVATRAGGIPDLIDNGRNGILVPPADPPALAEAIVAVLKDKQLADRITCAGRTEVEERFHLEKMVSDTLEIYKDVIWAAMEKPE